MTIVATGLRRWNDVGNYVLKASYIRQCYESFRGHMLTSMQRICVDDLKRVIDVVMIRSNDHSGDGITTINNYVIKACFVLSRFDVMCERQCDAFLSMICDESSTSHNSVYVTSIST